MKKYLYLIKKAKIKSWLKFWLMTNKQFTIVLSEILEGFSFNLQNTVKRYFKIFNIFGNSIQDGTPTPTNPVPIESVADDGSFTIDFEGQTENYNYTFITKPLRSLPNGVRDSLEDDGIHRRVGRVVFDGTEYWTAIWLDNGGRYEYQCFDTLTDSKRQAGATNNIICQSNYYTATHYDGGTGSLWDYRSNDNFPYLIAITDKISTMAGKVTVKNLDITTLADFKTWLSTHNLEVIYELNEEIIEPYTEEQQEQYNKIKELYTFDGTTNISSDDVVPPYLQIQYYMKGE